MVGFAQNLMKKSFHSPKFDEICGIVLNEKHGARLSLQVSCDILRREVIAGVVMEEGC